VRCEDGTVLFQRYYQEVSIAAVFGMWSGYVSVVPNLLACLECRLPALYVPYAFVITEGVVIVLAVTRLRNRRALDLRFERPEQGQVWAMVLKPL